MLSVRELRKTFGAVQAVDGVTFDAPNGMITGLLGPNGAGKTTTLRMLAGLIKPDQGRVAVDTIDVVANPSAGRRALGILPDARGLYPRLTARENIAYFAGLQQVPRAQYESTLSTLIERLDMSEIIDRRVDGFSQGQRAKVAIARALVHDPQNVLLDEPTNGLDVMMTRAMRDAVRGLKETGKCVLFSSHIMQEVSALCDQIIVISAGRVVAHGPVDSILEQAEADTLEDAFVRLTQGQE